MTCIPERKIYLGELNQLLKDPKWHNAMSDRPEGHGTYTVIVNQYRAKDTAWIRNHYRYYPFLGWMTPHGKLTHASVLAWCKEDYER